MARKTKKHPAQAPLPFEEVTPVPITPPIPQQAPVPQRAVRYEPSNEALAAFQRLETWLRDPRTGKPISDEAETTLHAVTRSLLEGRNGYWHVAENRLEALLAAPPSGVKPMDEK